MDETQLYALRITPAEVAADGLSAATATLSLANFAFPPGSRVKFASSEPSTIVTQPSAPDASGSWVGQVRSTVAGAQTVTAYAQRSPQTRLVALASAQVMFTAQQASATTSTLAAAPSAVSADGVSSSTITLQARDNNGLAVPAATVSLTVSGSSNVLGATSGVTDANGKWSTTLASTVAELKTVTVSINGFTLATSLTFSSTAPSQSKSTLAASPTNVADDGVTPTVVTVTVRDLQSNALSGQAVTFSTIAAAAALSASTGSTDSSGQFVTYLTSTVAQATSVTASFGGVSKSAAVTFVVGQPDVGQSSLTTNPTSNLANNSNVITLTAFLRDATGNAVPNAAVTFSATGSNNTLSATATFTGVSGQASATLASPKAENKTVGFSNAFVSKTAGVSFYAGSPVVGTSSFVATPTAVADDGVASSTLTLTLRDINNNPVNAQAVTFSTSATNPNLVPTSGVTDTNGVISTALRSTTAQSTSVTATFGGPSLSAAVTFLVGDPSPPNVTATYSPTILVADGVSTSLFSITVRDATNNPVPNSPLTFSSSNPCDILSHPTTSTDANGNGNSTFASTIAEVKTISVNSTFLSGSGAVTFVAGPPALSHSSLTATPSTVTGNGASLSVLKLSVADAFNNIVSNANVTFTASGYGGVIANRFMATDMNGKAQTNIHSAYFGARTVTAKVAPIQVTAAVTFATPASCTGMTVLYPELPLIMLDSGTSGIDSGDFNEDGHVDLAFAGGNVGISLARGNGLFNPLKRLSGTGYTSLAKAHLDGDGHLDLVTLSYGDTNIVTYNGTGDGNFVQSLSYVDIANNLDIAIGDMNGDGKADVVYLNLASNQVKVRLVNTAGALGSASTASTSVGPYGLALGDMNGDGYLDAVVSNLVSANIDVLLGTGTGTLGAKTSYAGTGPYVGVKLADFNLDGKLDVVVIAYGNTWFDTFQGNGSGGLGTRATTTTMPLSPFDIAAADMNADGAPDVVMTTSSGTVDVSLGNGNGSFQAAVRTNVGVNEAVMAVGDFDADGNLDVVALHSNAPRAAVLLGTGFGNLVTGSVSASLAFNNTGGALTDLNGDGNQDLLVTDYAGSRVFAGLGHGNGTFGAFPSVPIGNSPRGIGTTDFNNDGKLDAFAANGNSVMTLLGNGDGTFRTGVQGPEACPVDAAVAANFNGDAFVDVAFPCPLNAQVPVMLGNGDGTLTTSFTISTGQAASLAAKIAAADITGDGKVDILTTGSSDATVRVFPGTGNGSFGAVAQTLNFASNLANITAGDLNADGRPDAAVLTNDGSAYALLNAGGILSALPAFYCPITSPLGIAISDVDSDGWPDILVSGGGAFCIVHSTGSGTFGTITGYPSTSDTTAVMPADLNHDGLLDIVTLAAHSLGQPGDFYVVHLASGCSN